MKKQTLSKKLLLTLAGLVLVLTFPGCGGGGGSTPSAASHTGKARFTFNFGTPAARSQGAGAAKIPSETVKIRIEVKNTAVAPVELTSLAGTVTATVIDIPAGYQKFEIAAYDSSGNVVAHRVEGALINEGEITSMHTSLGMTITDTGLVPSSMTFDIGDRVYIKNASGATKYANLFSVVSGTDVRTCGRASGALLNDGGLLSCGLPSASVNAQMLSDLTSGDLTIKVVVDGVQLGTITVKQNASATNYPGSMNVDAQETEGVAPLTVNIRGASPGATATDSTWDFGDPYATSTTATGNSASHTYEIPGNYTITHTVINGTNTFTDTVHITVYEPPSSTSTPVAAVPLHDADVRGRSLLAVGYSHNVKPMGNGVSICRNPSQTNTVKVNNESCRTQFRTS